MKILIAGQPKSGTTALFYRVRNSMDPMPSCLFEPREYVERSDDSRGDLLAKVVITPETVLDGFGGFDKKVFIARDPRDNLVSTLLYYTTETTMPSDAAQLKRFLALLRKKEADPRSVSLREIVGLLEEIYPHCPFLEFWRKLQEAALDVYAAYPDYFRIRYEDVIDNRIAPLESYLGFSLSAEADVAPKHRRVARTKSYGDWKRWFTTEDVAHFAPLLSEPMRILGYPEEWTLDPAPAIPAAHASAYVSRIVAERRRKNRRQKYLSLLRRIFPCRVA